MKKNIIFIGLLVTFIMLAFLIVGCAPADEPDVAEPDEEAPEEAPEEELPYITARFAGIHPEGSSNTMALERFVNIVYDKTDGKLDFTFYPASQLGGSRDLIEMTQSGAIEGCGMAAAMYQPFEPAVGITHQPYLFQTREMVYDLLIEGDIGRDILDRMENVGLKGGGFIEIGFQQMTSNKEIREPEDMRGLTWRVMLNEVLVRQYTALGTTPTPIDYAELYTALQQGVVDGQENPLIGGIYESKLYEVQDYLILSSHASIDLLVAFNLEWFNSLPDAFQQALLDSVKEACYAHTEVLLKDEVEKLVEMEEQGTTIIELTPEQSASFEAIAAPAADAALRETLDDEALEIYERAIELSKDY